MKDKKPILCLDFDGVIHSYTSGWKGIGEIVDPPVPGVFDWMKAALEHFDIVVYSYRSAFVEGRMAMFDYIKRHGGRDLAQVVDFVYRKPRVHITIDDRCVRFNGDWSDPAIQPKILADFKPWNRQS